MTARIAPLLVVVAACGSAHGPQPPVPTPAAPVLTDERIDDLTSLAIGDTLPPAERAAVLGQLRSGALTIDGYIDRLIRDPRFSRGVVPHMLLGYLDFGPYAFALLPLKTQQVDGVTVYGKKPCALAETVEVAPWWDIHNTIRVCATEYRPTVLKTKDGANVCSGGTGLLSGECGCGPNLISCVPDGDKKAEVFRSFHQETVRTVAYIVEHDLPLGEIFTTNYSFRDQNVAYAYKRDDVYQGRIAQVPDLTTWPTEGTWAPRDEAWPGAQAGILTNRQLLWMTDGPRDRMRLYFDRAWCKSPSSFGVDIDVFRTLVHGAADLRNRGARWQQLAAQPGCTTCHARTDYGMQFFAGYPSAFTSLTGTPETSRHAETGAFYADDIDDKRGEGKLTPRAFGELLVSQHEFADCMVDDVERHVLGTATPEERAQLLRTFDTTKQLRPVFALALRQYVMRPAHHAAEPTALPPFVPAPVTADGRSVLGKRLVAMLSAACADCHAQSGRIGFLAGVDKTRALPRERIMEMANLVAEGAMPKNQPMSVADRQALLTELVAAIAPDREWARSALGYWRGDDYQPSRTHHITALAHRAAAEAGGTVDEIDTHALVDHSLEKDLLRLTPAAVMEMAKIAAKACARVPVEQRQACFTRATRPDVAGID